MLSESKNESKGLNPNEATAHNNIPPPKIRPQSAKVTANTMQLLFNNAVSNSELPENLKLAELHQFSRKKTF